VLSWVPHRASVRGWLALAQAHRGVVLADRLPKVAALFETGISEVLLRTIEYRSALVTDDEAIERVDALLAGHVTVWGPLSVTKTEQAIDAIVDRVDPGALRRSRKTSCQRDVEFGSPSDEAGFTQHVGPVVCPGCVGGRACWAVIRLGPAPSVEHSAPPALVIGGDAPPEPRYTPSPALADFVRCRDLTCR
jgi:hypothetical protein